MDDEMDITGSKIKKKFYNKVLDDPAIPLGFIAFFAVGIYGIRSYKNQKYRDPTAYFGSLRVIAQGHLLEVAKLGKPALAFWTSLILKIVASPANLSFLFAGSSFIKRVLREKYLNDVSGARSQ